MDPQGPLAPKNQRRYLLICCAHPAAEQPTLQEAWHSYCTLLAREREAGLDATPESHGRQLASLRAVMDACRGVATSLVSVSDPSEQHQHAMQRLQGQLERTASQLEALAVLVADEAQRAVAGRFEWVDGVLTRAIASGGWVLLDNANLCNATVLDRLNPLLEPGGESMGVVVSLGEARPCASMQSELRRGFLNRGFDRRRRPSHPHAHNLKPLPAGVLFMNECGSIGGRPRVVVPHPDFRLILALDPRHGEVCARCWLAWQIWLAW